MWFAIVSIVVSLALLVVIIFSISNCVKKNKVEGITDQEKKKNRKIAVVQIVIGYLLIGFISMPLSEKYEKEQEELANVEKLTEEENQKKLLAEKFNVQPEVFSEIEKLFSSSGLGIIDDVIFNGSFEAENGTDMDSIFIVKLKDRNEGNDSLIVEILNNEKIKSIVLNSFVIFENGELKNQVQPYYFNMNDREKIDCLTEIRKYIRTQVLVPSTLKMTLYPSEYVWGRDGVQDVVVGSFESENAFGVPLITNFKAYINRKDRTFTVKFL